LTLRPRKLTCGYIHVYRLIRGVGGAAGAGGLVLLHKTEVKEVPYAMCAFNGRLLVGIGNTLRIYNLGKLKLLRKCECRGLPVLVTSVCTMGDRVYASDLSNGFVYLKYKRSSNELVVYADDIVPRFMTQALLLDYDTMLGADKFGNVFASRLPDKSNDDVHNPTGNRILWSTGYLNSAKNKLDTVANFHCGELITAMRKTQLVPGGAELVLCAGIMGGIRVLMPLPTREDVDFLVHLETYMRAEQNSLAGRDQLSFRSAFMPVKACIDGDLCECFATLPLDRQKNIAGEMDRTVSEILKKLETLRNRIL